MQDKSLLERIVKARELAGLSNGQAARLLGVSQSSLSQYENANRKITPEMIKRMARVYGVSEIWLFSGVSEMSQDEINQIADLAGSIKMDDLDRLIDLLTMLRQHQKPVEKDRMFNS